MRLNDAPSSGGYIDIEHYISANSQRDEYRIGQHTSTRFYTGDELIDVDLSSSYFIFPGTVGPNEVTPLPQLNFITFYTAVASATVKNINVQIYGLYIKMDEM